MNAYVVNIIKTLAMTAAYNAYSYYKNNKDGHKESDSKSDEQDGQNRFKSRCKHCDDKFSDKPLDSGSRKHLAICGCTYHFACLKFRINEGERCAFCQGLLVREKSESEH